MKHNNFLFILLILISISVFAKQVPIDQAKELARKAYYERISQIEVLDINSIELTAIHTETVNNTPIYYVFNVGNDQGFVIITADDNVKPIIGYSFEGHYDSSNLPPSFDFFIGKHRDAIAYALEQKITATPEIKAEWAHLAEIKNGKFKKMKTILPLLLTEWGQAGYYNAMCPEDNGEVAVVGCVALSMAQVMKFYNYPDQGQGSHSYSYPSGWPTYWPYGTLSANFGNTTYHWDNMPYDAVCENDDLALFLYHCGVSVNMMYGPDGSGTQTIEVENALTNYFKYNAQYVDRNSYSESDWISLLQTNIDNYHPLVYAGTSSNGGHAWNCDGYQGTDFHMNWGWDGALNGYYALDNLSAGGYDFTSGFEAVVNIYPLSGYPEFCSGTKTIDGVNGSFDDGSGNQPYENNQDCFYQISPACGNVITASFDVFQIESNDAVRIFEGTSTSDTLLAEFYGTDTPTSKTAKEGNMLIEFETDATGTDIGWYLTYKVDKCSSSMTLESPSGTITDGSGPCDYDNGTYCKWTLQPPGATSVTINFNSFNLTSNDTYDYVKIYKDDLDLSNNLYSFTSANPPSGQYFIPSGKVIIRFVTNSSETSSGWSLDYTSSTSDVNEIAEYDHQLNVFPNPINHKTNIGFMMQNHEEVIVTVKDLLGKTIGTLNHQATIGNNVISLSKVAGQLNSGIYLVTLKVDGKEITKKVVCTQ